MRHQPFFGKIKCSDGTVCDAMDYNPLEDYFPHDDHLVVHLGKTIHNYVLPGNIGFDFNHNIFIGVVSSHVLSGNGNAHENVYSVIYEVNDMDARSTQTFEATGHFEKTLMDEPIFVIDGMEKLEEHLDEE